MQESYWMKQLLDGAKELGTDSLITQGKASWSRGRQDILSVTLSFAGTTLRLDCLEALEWKQFDNYIYSVARGGAFRTSREIICRPKMARGIIIRHKNNEVEIEINPRLGGTKLPGGTEALSVCILSNGRWTCKCIKGGEQRQCSNL